MGLGRRIKTLRKLRGFNLTELAKRSKVSKAYLSQLENERFNNPTTEVVIRLSAALGVSLENILGLESVPLKIIDYSNIPSPLHALAQEEHLNDEDVSMLSSISYRGKRPTSQDGWRKVLEAIRQSTK